VDSAPVVERGARRVLCIAGVHPWPATDGYRQRLGALIEGLTALGPVDLWCFDDALRDPTSPRAEAPAGVTVVPIEVPRTGVATRVRRWLTSGLPRAMVRRQVTEASVPPGGAAGYDLVLYSHLDAWLHFRDVVEAPAIVDFDNLEDLMLRAKRETPRPRPSASGVAAVVVRARELAVDLADRVDERRFTRLQDRCAAAVGAVALCSELDVRRSGLPNARCIANGYTLDHEPPAERPERPDPALLFVGLLSYEPNADAVRWFATDVFPRVRAQVPGARFRVVGRGGDALAAELAGRPGVELVGPVDDVRVELDAATATVVPIRFGAGTRLKVVEALANRLPLASTTIGCEGIEVQSGVHCLVADDAASLAAACVRLLTEADLRASLAEAGARLHHDRYRWSTIQSDMVALAEEVMAGRR
jgi:glycosyltransferase involved in cell wall biosynthesis